MKEMHNNNNIYCRLLDKMQHHEKNVKSQDFLRLVSFLNKNKMK